MAIIFKKKKHLKLYIYSYAKKIFSINERLKNVWSGR